ncbi:MAG: hypothetical protein A2293_03465 [Elusimicrobia bacterium RIFOXYB2_FULL_49_7]|nr:MAG: hypothetical protein A2293_03465 [Elusimicrobia bacterium RIFOXYB2_FULL_49_7]
MRPPKDERVRFNADYPPDTEFSAFGRLLQSKWRERKKYPIGKLGSFIDTEFAKANKANFLTDNIKQLVTNQISEAKIIGGLIGEPRIWNNLLSSQPLCFNLFGELHFNLDMATSFFTGLFPDRIDKVTSVKFEYSPGRGNDRYLGDYSAFDVFVEYDIADKKGFIGIEVKYAESLKEETEEKAIATFKERYAQLAFASGLFKTNSVDALKLPPLSQIWRDHLLSIATIQDYHTGFFVFLFPSGNKQCQIGVDRYRTNLSSEDERLSGFYPRHLEDFIFALHGLYKADWTKELKERYLGLSD